MYGPGLAAGPALREGAGVTEFLSYTITGLSLAAILAVAASGLVLTYTTTGVFNFAHGAIGMLGAFAYWQLRFEWNWPAPLSIAIVLLVLGPLFGAFLEVAIFRGLQGTSETVKLVVTVSLLFSMIGIANWIWNPTEAHNATKFFNTTRPYFIGDVPITRHELITIVVAVLVAIGLRYLLYHTRAGIAMRAAVDDRPLAALHGAHPDRSSMLAWAIGCSLAALSGILFVGTIDLASTPMALLIVNAYAAAMIGRLRSLPYTFLGALMLGLLSGYLQGYLVVKNNQYLDSSFVSAVPVIVLFIVLLILPSSRLRAQGIARTREIIPMPTMRGTFIFSAVIVGGTALAIPLLTRSNTVTMARLFGIGIVALSMVPLIGLAGQVSLAQWSLAGLGAITMAHLGVGGSPAGIFWAFVLTATVGALIALPTLRLSGIYLALATAAFAVFLERWIFGLPPFNLPFSDVKISIFGTGSLTVAPPQVVRLPVRHRVPTAHAARNDVRAPRHLRGVVAARCVRPALARDEGLPRGLRDGRDEPHVHEARGVLDLGRHRGDRRRADRWFAAQHEPPGLAVRGRPSRVHGRRRGRHRAHRWPAVRRHQPRDARRDADVADPAQHQLVPEPGRGHAGVHGHRPRAQPERRGRRHPRSVRPVAEAQGRLRDVPRRGRRAVRDRARHRHRRVVVRDRRRDRADRVHAGRRGTRPTRPPRSKPRPASSSRTSRWSGSASIARSLPKTSRSSTNGSDSWM